MSDFDPASCLERYRALVRARPDQFANPPGEIYEILLDAEQIARAQRDAFTDRQREGLRTEDTRVGVLAVDPYLTVMRDAVRFADGSYGLYNRLLVPSGAAIMPLVGESIALLHRFRHGTRRWHLEVPRGAFSGVGTRKDEAERELVEEIGAAPIDELIDLGILHSTTGCLDEEHQLFLARIASVGRADKHEAIESIKVLPTRTVEQLIADGEITDGPTLAVFLRARLRGIL
jgi:ADP-ribose pyrophosphatase